MRGNEYAPEGAGSLFPEGQGLEALREAMEQQTVWEGTAVRCNGKRDLIVHFGGYTGLIPRTEAVHPAISGAERDIAILSRVGRSVCFTIRALTVDGGGRPHATLSRRAAQEQALAFLLDRACPGTVLPARVTHLAPFGAFVDLGCGVVSLLPLENISVSRIPHPTARFYPGEDILVRISAVDPSASRFYLSHKELLGTWMENAAAFAPGDAVTGIVRGVREYGIFIELSPNLSGLADWRGDVHSGDAVSVYIKSIRPETRKIKLQVIENLGPAPTPGKLHYFITDGVVDNWVY